MNRSNSLILNNKRILIIGQGLAGTILAWTLRRAGFDVKIIADGLEKSASQIAAGIINPITGKRFVKTWMLDELLPVAKNAYKLLAEELDAPIFQEKIILKLLGSVKEANDWSARCALPDCENYMAERRDGASWQPILSDGFHFGELRSAGQLDLPKLLSLFRKKAISEGILETEVVDYQQFNFKSGQAFYRKENFEKVIFCEGAAAISNPFFKNKIAWRLAKGEALIVRIPDFQADEILKKQLLVASLGDSLFWVGSNYDWNFSDAQPTAAVRPDFEAELRAMIRAPFEVVEHLAAIRPTIFDRKPVLGFLAENPTVGIFNGLGTKGVLLVPFFAQEFCEHILTNKKLLEVVDFQRFTKIQAT